MQLSGWGNYPKAEAEIIRPRCPADVERLLLEKQQTSTPGTTFIARGMGRSYGDSSLAQQVISSASLNHFLEFDESSGVLTCGAGVTLADILSVFVPKGWFLPVTPGTKFITVGGAIASDVHGKNHHIEGCFSEHVQSFRIATVAQGIIQCSPHCHPELFHATCGGMGLTGLILEVTFQLKPIKSTFIHETILKAQNLEEALTLFETHKEATYSVAWIDCLANGISLGRSLVSLGEHVQQGERHMLKPGKPGQLAIPINLPGFILNRHTIAAFNSLYYNRARKPIAERLSHYENYFYPLDGIHHWNRLYGNNGFVQYQFVVPRQSGLAGITTVLKRIASSKRGSFLAVLKILGKGNGNYLSFPMEGYTLALDFKMDKSLLPLLNELDSIILNHGGRLYLTKDSRMSAATFRQGYSQWAEFQKVRTIYGADKLFNSLQSQRLGF